MDARRYVDNAWVAFFDSHGYCPNTIEDGERLAHVAFIVGAENGLLHGRKLDGLVEPDDETLMCSDSKCNFIQRSFVAGIFAGIKLRCSLIAEYRCEKLRAKEMLRVVEALKNKYKSAVVMTPDGSLMPKVEPLATK